MDLSFYKEEIIMLAMLGIFTFEDFSEIEVCPNGVKVVELLDGELYGYYESKERYEKEVQHSHPEDRQHIVEPCSFIVDLRYRHKSEQRFEPKQKHIGRLLQLKKLAHTCGAIKENERLMDYCK